MQFKVLSLFDGISCGQVALHRAGIIPNLYMASEIDKNAIACTQSNFPQTVQLGDVVKVRQMAEAGLFGVADIDLLMGGSPCQGFSSGGEGLGFDDPRSALFFEFVRIKNAIKPKNFLLENVKMRKDWLDLISLYMGVDPVFINSSDFSAQKRARFYWTNLTVTPWVDSGITLPDVLDDGWFSEKEKSYCIDANYGKGTNLKRYNHRGSRQIVFRKGLTIPKTTEENANFIQRLILDQWRMLTVAECERLQTLPNGYTHTMKKQDAYKAIGNGWTVDVIAHIFRGLHHAIQP